MSDDSAVVLPRKSIHSNILNTAGASLRRRLSSLSVFNERALNVVMHREPAQQLGIRLVLHDPQGSRRGATVGSVDPHCLAWRAGLMAGDLISAITLATGERTVVTGGYQAREVLGGAIGEIELSLRRRRWTEDDFAAVRMQCAWRGAAVRFKMQSLHFSAGVVQEAWRGHAYNRRRAWELAATRPSILAAARLSSGSSLDSSSRTDYSHPASMPGSSHASRRDSGSSEGLSEHSSTSSKASRRDSFAFVE